MLGCEERPSILDESLEISGPMVVGRYVAYLDHTRERLTILRPYHGTVRHVALGRRPASMSPSPHQDRLFVLCRGWLATHADEVDESPSLHVVDPETGDVEVTHLASPYDEIAVSDDDRYAVVFFSANRDPSDTEVFRNPNSVTVINLESGETFEKSVRSFGDVPRGVTFSPSTMAPLNPDGSLGTPRTLAVVFADGYITILDVNHPERREVTVRLALPGSSAVITPERVVFAPSTGTAYLRASGSNDVYVLTLTSRDSSDEDENDFVVSINTLAAGSVPADVALFNDGDRQMVLVANQQTEDVTVVDTQTAEFFTIDVGDPIDRILTYPPENPEVAVLFSQASPRQSVYFLELDDVEAHRGRNLTELRSDHYIVRVELIPNRALALVTHDDTRSVMSVLNIAEQTLSPFTGHAGLVGYALTVDGSLLAGYGQLQQRLGVVDLDHLSSHVVALDHLPSSVLALAATDDDLTDPELRTVVVDHGERFGMVTVLTEPLNSGREGAFVMSGFLLQGIFDERYGE